MIENASTDASVLWQKSATDPHPQEAILIDRYDTSFTLTQYCDGERNSISLNYESAKELAKFLSKIEPPE